MRFTGQEDQAPDFGIPYTDFGARHYSPALSRWLVPDPLGEKYYDVSPYAYCEKIPSLPGFRPGKEGSKCLVQQGCLLRSEDAVTGVAEARNDVGVLVEVVVHRGQVNVYVGMLGLDTGNAFRRTDQAHQPDVLASSFLEHRQGVTGAAARRQHRIRHDDHAALDVFGKLAIINHRVVGFLVAVKTDMADFGDRYQILQSFNHAHSGAEDRDNGELASGNLFSGCPAEGRLDFDILERNIPGHLVAHQEGDFLEQFPEVFGSGLFVPHNRQLVLDHGMVDNMQLAHSNGYLVLSLQR